MLAIMKIQDSGKQLFVNLPKEICTQLKLTKKDKLGFDINSRGNIELIVMKGEEHGK